MTALVPLKEREPLNTMIIARRQKVVTTVSMVKEAIAKHSWLLEQANGELCKVGPEGKDTQRFHKHCLRVSGAQFLARLGLQISTIQLYSRHSSDANMTYSRRHWRRCQISPRS